MSADGSARNTLASQSSTSSSGSENDGRRRRKEYWKKDKKIVRILTVVMYIVSVSIAAVLLSAYYVFLWNPEVRNPRVGKPLALEFHGAGAEDAVFPSYETPEYGGDRDFDSEGRTALGEPSFAMSASQFQIGGRKKRQRFYLHYTNTNTKAYQQKQIPTPPSTLVKMTRRLTIRPVPDSVPQQQSTTPISRGT